MDIFSLSQVCQHRKGGCDHTIEGLVVTWTIKYCFARDGQRSECFHGNTTAVYRFEMPNHEYSTAASTTHTPYVQRVCE